MPMSACFSAGASLTPSPVMATTSPSPRRTLRKAELLLRVDAGEDDLALGETAAQLVIVERVEPGRLIT